MTPTFIPEMFVFLWDMSWALFSSLFCSLPIHPFYCHLHVEDTRPPCPWDPHFSRGLRSALLLSAALRSHCLCCWCPLWVYQCLCPRPWSLGALNLPLGFTVPPHCPPFLFVTQISAVSRGMGSSQLTRVWIPALPITHWIILAFNPCKPQCSHQ